MTPENQAVTPESQAEKPYVSAANEVIARAAQNLPETTESFKIIDSHVDSILEAADKGEITGTHGTYTKEFLLSQISDFLKDMAKPAAEGETKNPFTFIPSADGLRSSFRLIMENPATARNFQDSLALHVEAHEKKRAELLSAENIKDMGEVEVAAAGGVEPMAEAKRAATGMIEVPEHIRNPAGSAASAEAVSASTPAEQPVEAPASPEEETELQMNERFLRESQAELQDLYAQHRAAVPRSYEQSTLENQIKHAKEDVGNFARKVAKLKGNSNWL